MFLGLKIALIASPVVLVGLFMGLLYLVMRGKSLVRRAAVIALAVTFIAGLGFYAFLMWKTFSKIPSEGFDSVFDPLTGVIVYWALKGFPWMSICFSLTWFLVVVRFNFKNPKFKFSLKEKLGLAAWGTVCGVGMAWGVLWLTTGRETIQLWTRPWEQLMEARQHFALGKSLALLNNNTDHQLGEKL